MSFAFTVSGEQYDKKQHLRRIKQFRRIYDVAAVDIPAYDSTEISARSFFLAEAEKDKTEVLKRRKQRLKIRLLMEESQ